MVCVDLNLKIALSYKWTISSLSTEKKRSRVPGEIPALRPRNPSTCDKFITTLNRHLLPEYSLRGNPETISRIAYPVCTLGLTWFASCEFTAPTRDLALHLDYSSAVPLETWCTFEWLSHSAKSYDEVFPLVVERKKQTPSNTAPWEGKIERLNSECVNFRREDSNRCSQQTSPSVLG